LIDYGTDWRSKMTSDEVKEMEQGFRKMELDSERKEHEWDTQQLNFEEMRKNSSSEPGWSRGDGDPATLVRALPPESQTPFTRRYVDAVELAKHAEAMAMRAPKTEDINELVRSPAAIEAAASFIKAFVSVDMRMDPTRGLLRAMPFGSVCNHVLLDPPHEEKET
jgi:hypothetical protein